MLHFLASMNMMVIKHVVIIHVKGSFINSINNPTDPGAQLQKLSGQLRKTVLLR